MLVILFEAKGKKKKEEKVTTPFPLLFFGFMVFWIRYATSLSSEETGLFSASFVTAGFFFLFLRRMC